MERGRGFEPPRPAWKAGMLAVEHQPRIGPASFVYSEGSRKQSLRFKPFIPPTILFLAGRIGLVSVAPVMPYTYTVFPPFFKCFANCFIVTNVIMTKIFLITVVL